MIVVAKDEDSAAALQSWIKRLRINKQVYRLHYVDRRYTEGAISEKFRVTLQLSS